MRGSGRSRRGGRNDPRDSVINSLSEEAIKRDIRRAALKHPATLVSLFLSILFYGALLIEIIFSLDGLGLLGFEAVIKRDYPIMFASVYFFTLIGLVMVLVRDFTYTLVDPRIDFEGRHV